MIKGKTRFTSMIMAVVFSLMVIFGAMNAAGVSLVSAESSTYRDELWLLFDNENALVRGEKKNIGASAYFYMGDSATAYEPLTALLLYTGATASRDGDTVTVTRKDGSKATLTVGSAKWLDGEMNKEFLLPVVERGGEIFLSTLSMKAVFGLHSFYNTDIGLVVFSESKLSYTMAKSSLNTQILTLGNLLFERPSGEKMYSDMLSHLGEDTHPRLLINQDRFDYLRSVYNDPTIDLKLAEWIGEYMSVAESEFMKFFSIHDGKVDFVSSTAKNKLRQPYYIYDENGNRLVGESTYTYIDDEGNVVTLKCSGSGLGDGYDEGGRSEPHEYAGRLMNFGFAWQMTGDDKYKDAFYLVATELGKWEHWGEGHFLNCADASLVYSIGFDWIYDAFAGEEEKREELAAILYEKGLMSGYYSIMADTPGSELYGNKDNLHMSEIVKSGYTIINRQNNWQPVCGAGMILSAFVLMDYEDYNEKAMFVAETMLRCLEKFLPYYAPDGSYIESTGYWSYATRATFYILATLESACGDSYGYYDIIGLDTTAYYAHYICDSDYYSWNYHDSGSGITNRDIFYLASRAFDDPTIAKLRDDMFENSTKVNPGIFDILFYDPKLSEGASEDSLPLDHHMTGIDTVTMRSSWDSGATFVGLHAGPTKSPHGDSDSGNIFLRMKGITWIGDPGAESYNVSNYFSSLARYRYYKKSAESHTTVIMTDESGMEFGQVFNTNNDEYARISKFVTNEHGSIAVADMSPQYGASCLHATRALMLTNSRSSVVLQDEMYFNEPKNLVWLCPIQGIDEMSEDGRTLYMSRYKGDTKYTMRLTLLSENESLKFRFTNTNEKFLKNTYINADCLKKDEGKCSDPERRVVIEADGVTEFNVAVVFELIRHKDEVVGYDMTPISEWQTTSDEWVKEANSGIVYPEDNPKPVYKYKLSDFKKTLARLEGVTDMKELGEIILETIVYTTDCDMSNRQIASAVEEYMKHVEAYNERVRELKKRADHFFLGI